MSNKSIQAIICDFSGVILQRIDTSITTSYTQHYHQLSQLDNFHFTDHFTFNDELVHYLRVNHYQLTLALFSNSQLYSLAESSHVIGTAFDYIFTPDGIARKKTDPEAYEIIAATLDINPSQILFIDDQEENVKAALHAGLQATHFHSNAKMIQYLKSLHQS